MLQQQMGLKTLACTAEVVASLDRLIDESHGRGERVWRLSIQIAQRHVDRFEGGGGVEAVGLLGLGRLEPEQRLGIRRRRVFHVIN